MDANLTKLKMSNNSPEEVPAGQSLEFYEQVIERGRPNLDNVASALLEIHRNKLYRLGFKTFEEYLFRRWDICRSRGYQLIRFAKLRRMSTTVDALPANERQARATPNGGRNKRPDLVLRAIGYLGKLFHRLDLKARAELIQEVRKLLGMLEQVLEQYKEGSTPKTEATPSTNT